ncbi:tRNA dihydrouridine synthase DusB [Hydrogenibacillus schlegelii]|uniref:tRNA-dihydrouridine synthase n=1 Tax=Hydrogenibacillus schlegelii TaxID=1484 RepID=A0A132NBU5_HYDSH|nr:tRNA dihydrouridine synthase DusB [Hydrogenibacillus schlegelii]KWX07032.1 tRNA-dihydrouridine synthase [Hydrogenibacillus schlegelii]OAR04091.1 tRNA-dihydrouridine synthase [Hydrogenibacillus schlegelii]
MWMIGDVTIPNRVVLAPMAGVTNLAFRRIVKRFGAGLIYTEMVSDVGLIHGNAQTRAMLTLDPEEHPVAIQLFGGDARTLAEAARIVEAETDADIIDINLGCPAPKINRLDAGARWLLSPDRVYNLYRAVTSAVRRPVTAKIRLGWDADRLTYREVALAIAEGGGKAVAVHGRTRAQMYEGRADWEAIAEVKDVLRPYGIPVIGNGDVDTPEKAAEMLRTTGVDAVMIGRAALGNPWLIYRTVRYLETGELIPEPTPGEKATMALEHFRALVELRGEAVAVREMRKHAAWYLRGIRGGAALRAEVNRAESAAALRAILERIRDAAPAEAVAASFR